MGKSIALGIFCVWGVLLNQLCFSYGKQFDDRKYLSKILPYYSHNGVTKFYNVTEIFKHNQLFCYIINRANHIIQKHNIDIIISPEARSLPIAGALAFLSQKPLVIIRKEGKLPGPTFKKTYKTAYSTNVIEIAKDDALKGKSALIIDDGIASGGTTVACIELVQMAGINVKKILAIINHHYAKRAPQLRKYNSKIETFYDF